jgi:hypothetical protein
MDEPWPLPVSVHSWSAPAWAAGTCTARLLLGQSELAQVLERAELLLAVPAVEVAAAAGAWVHPRAGFASCEGGPDGSHRPLEPAGVKGQRRS